MARSYDNRRREQKAQKTRRRILDAAVTLLAEGPAESVQIAAVASGSGTSEATVYRHFSNRDTLLRAAAAEARRRLELPELPLDLDALPRVVAARFATFSRHRELVTADLSVNEPSEERRVREQRQRGRRWAMLDEAVENLDETSARQVFAIFGLLTDPVAWDVLQRELGEDGDPGAAAAWALGVLIDALRRHDAGTPESRKE